MHKGILFLTQVTVEHCPQVVNTPRHHSWLGSHHCSLLLHLHIIAASRLSHLLLHLLQPPPSPPRPRPPPPLPSATQALPASSPPPLASAFTTSSLATTSPSLCSSTFSAVRLFKCLVNSEISSLFQHYSIYCFLWITCVFNQHQRSYCSVYELFLHDSLHCLMSIIPNLIYFLYTRAGMYFIINNKASIFTRYVFGNMLLMEALKSWLLIGRANLISTNGLSFTFCSQPFEPKLSDSKSSLTSSQISVSKPSHWPGSANCVQQMSTISSPQINWSRYHSSTMMIFSLSEEENYISWHLDNVCTNKWGNIVSLTIQIESYLVVPYLLFCGVLDWLGCKNQDFIALWK